MRDNASQSYASSSASQANLHPISINVQSFGDFAWRILIVAIGYALTSLIAIPLLGRGFDAGGLGITVLSGILIGAILVPIAARMQLSRFRQGVVSGSALFLNALSLGIEGSFFAPALSPMVTMPLAWTAYLLFQSLAIAGLIAWLSGQNAGLATFDSPWKRPWFSWAWRFIVSSFSYLLFYFIFGAINYALVTKPYYQAHVSGLAVPLPQTVLMAEAVRAPMVVLSILPLIVLWRGRKRTLAVLCGIILFVIGGVIPLLLNTSLPDLLRFASAIEIFFQNFSTGLVAASLLGFREESAEQTQSIQANSMKEEK